MLPRQRSPVKPQNGAFGGGSLLFIHVSARLEALAKVLDIVVNRQADCTDWARNFTKNGNNAILRRPTSRTQTTRIPTYRTSEMAFRSSPSSAMQTVYIVAVLACVCGVYGSYRPAPAPEYVAPQPQPWRYVDPHAPQPQYGASYADGLAPRYRRGYGPAPAPEYVAPVYYAPQPAPRSYGYPAPAPE
ncbi:hypothetical protein BV898_15190 [Hypsibius exemplaris]|uniref:Uncharacterized protein n=1 Tax=Hypsibius exemplaris TaxID=2072580 RepID=A0A9X6NB02_HYPEX|nr:hypothetical protein BV898_15190 [Hypsibius exemplaris]